MKRDEISAVFPEATKDQIDAVLALYARDVNPLHARVGELQAQVGTATQSASDAQAALEEAKSGLASQVQAQLDALKAREAEFSLRSNRLDALDVFAQAGLVGDSYKAVVELVVSEDAERTAAGAKALADALAAERASAAQAAQAELLGSVPKPDGADPGSAPVTRAQFDALPWAEQVRMVGETPGLLASLK